MTEDVPAYDELERGHVVLGSDPFRSGGEAVRPWIVVSSEAHPFHGEQYIGMALTTRTWYDDLVPLQEEDLLHRRTPEASSIIPHAVRSLQPDGFVGFVCRVRQEPVDEAVEMLAGYL